MKTTEDHPLVGSVIGGRYRVTACVSDHPSAGVFEAYQDETQRLVSLKLLYGAIPEDSLFT